jgi:hypothetical protein
MTENDDWRLRVEVEDDADSFLERLLNTEARELAAKLRQHRLAVTRDGDTIFVYAPTRGQAEQARELVEQELGGAGSVVLEQWLPEEERWSDEPPHPDTETDLLERGFAPWEVRVELDSREEASQLAEQLRAEGYSVTRGFRYLIVGTDSRESAVELAKRIHGEVEPGGELVYEAQPSNPFAFVGALLGGLGESGVPL